MPYYQFPGTDFHDLNLDWLLQQMKNCLAEWATTKTAWETLSADNAEFKTQIESEWDELKTFVTDYFANLDVSQEISDKINAMAADGSLMSLIYATVAETSADAADIWLAANITQEAGYVLDDSLSLTNAAATGKAAGTAARSAMNAADAANMVHIPVQWRFLWASGNALGWQTGYWTNSGSTSSSTANLRTNMKIRTLADGRYPALFYRAACLEIQPPTNMPEGTQLTIYEFKSGVNTASYQLSARTIVPINEGCEYTIHTRNSGVADVSSYLNTTTLDSMEAVLYCYQPDLAAFYPFDFRKTVNEATYNKHGWTAGNGDNNSSIDRTKAVFNPIKWSWSEYRRYFAINVSFVDTTANPSVKLYGNLYYSNNGTSTYLTTITLKPGVPIYLMPEFTIMFCVGNLTQSPEEALSSWVDTNVAVTILAEDPDIKLPRFREFDRFYVQYDANWPERGTSSSEVPAENIQDILCALSVPSSYRTVGAKSPVLMYCHGSNGYIDDSTWYTTSSNFTSMIRAFTAAGFVVFDVNNTRNLEGGFADWGCLPLVRAYRAAWEYIKRNYNVEDKLYILSSSMGTMANLTFMKMFGEDVIASMITAPRVGLIDRYEAYSNDTEKKQMLVAYGLYPDSILSDDTFVPPDSSVFDIQSIRGFAHGDFIPMIGDKPVIPLRFPPIKVIIGGADQSYNDDEIRLFFEGLTNAGNITFTRTVAGVDHAGATFLSSGTLKEEAVEWFESFRK